MSRAASPWQWRIALRDYCRLPPSVMFTLYTLGSYMNREGFAFPSQSLIAKGARCSVKTVRRHIEAAIKAGWLVTMLAGKSGQAWRHYCYQAGIPDSVPLTEQDEYISGAIAAQVGQPQGGDTAMSSPSVPREVPQAERGDIQAQKVGTFGCEGGDTGGQKVGTQLCRTNSYSETPTSRTHALEEARLSPSARDIDRNREQERKTEMASTLARLTDNSPKFSTGEPRGLPRKREPTDSERFAALASKVRRLHEAAPDLHLTEIARQLGTEYATVKRILPHVREAVV